MYIRRRTFENAAPTYVGLGTADVGFVDVEVGNAEVVVVTLPRIVK